MQPNPSESRDQLPNFSGLARFGAAQGRCLLETQARQLRGLATRWKKLSDSFAVDSVVLSEKTQAFQQDFRQRSFELASDHKRQIHELLTEWDEQLDLAVGKAELGTLEKTQWERQNLKMLRSKRKDSQAKQESDHANARARLESELDKARAAARHTRDQSFAKLQTEQASLEELGNEIREWVALKTGGTPWAQSADSGRPPRTTTSIESLSAMAKEYEALKAKFLERKAFLESSKAANLVRVPLLGILGLLAGGGAFGVAYALKSNPVILAVASLLSAILVPVILYMAALPWVGRSIRSTVQALFEEERELFELLQSGRAIAEATLKRDSARLEEAHRKNLADAQERHNELMAQIDSDYQTNKAATLESTARDKRKFSEQRIADLDRLNHAFPSQRELLERKNIQLSLDFQKESQASLDNLRSSFQDSQQTLTKRWTCGVEQFQEFSKQADTQIQLRFPPWNDPSFAAENWHRDEASLAIPLGKFQPHQSVSPDHPAKSRVNEFKQLRNLAKRLEAIGPMPLTYDLIGNGGLILRTQDAECREQAHLVMRNLLLRAITAIPAGMLQVTVIDPEGLGKKYSWLMHLADVDPELVNHRVWTQPIHIANQLALTTRHIEDVIQQSLRNEYRDLYEYNQKAGPMAIPYRIIVWSGFPFGLDDSSWQSLCSILSSGSRCGVGMLIDWPSSIQCPTFADPNKLSEFALLGNITKPSPGGFQLRIDVPELVGFPVELEPPPDESTVASIMQKHLVAASGIGKRIVPFSMIASDSSRLQTRSSAEGLEIPIGISDSGRIQSLVLGEGTSQHVLIAGKTGSGKSSLLHTMISSAALEYAPEELRLVLLDFKKGVEFQVYSELQLSHTDIIGIESRREFGLSTLEYLDRILSARGEAFRQWGVQDLPSLKRKHPKVSLPRILIVIDEFQELFVEDDKISQQASMLMDRIVRQGRSFGMHLVLASQTLGGAYSLPRTTLAQMSVRIALQCDSADAMLILSEDNTAAERLRHSGQGIYNTAGGRLEANQNFQVAYLAKNEQLERLGKIPAVAVPHAPTTNPIGKRVVFEGHKLAVWDTQSIRSSLAAIPNPASNRWTLGDSVSIEPAVIRTLDAAPGRNAMIVTSHDDLVASLIASWIKTSDQRGPMDRGANAQAEIEATDAFWILDGSRTEDTAVQRLLVSLRGHQACKIYPNREIDEVFNRLDLEHQRRLAQPHQRHNSIVVCVLNLAKFRELRREEDYSFGGDQNGTSKPDAVFSKLLSDGPSVGIHLCIWSDSVATLSRWLSRGSIRDIELRILGQMSANDSNQLIDNNQANRLDRNVMLVHDDADGKATKFRPFTLDSLMGN
ncbi:MAG: FtsK/SpoIIIE domain-containing protein [Planctomycetota bacterium]|nr:FtsK/SpoIIIE domain-containing protein [Planctomycetota bacterium]